MDGIFFKLELYVNVLHPLSETQHDCDNTKKSCPVVST